MRCSPAYVAQSWHAECGTSAEALPRELLKRIILAKLNSDHNLHDNWRLNVATQDLYTLARLGFVCKEWHAVVAHFFGAPGEEELLQFPDGLPEQALATPGGLLTKWATSWKTVKLDISTPGLHLPSFRAFLRRIPLAHLDIEDHAESLGAGIGSARLLSALPDLSTLRRLSYRQLLPCPLYPPHLTHLNVEDCHFEDEEFECMFIGFSSCQTLQEVLLDQCSGDVVLQSAHTTGSLPPSLRCVELYLGDPDPDLTLDLSGLSAPRSFELSLNWLLCLPHLGRDTSHPAAAARSAAVSGSSELATLCRRQSQAGGCAQQSACHRLRTQMAASVSAAAIFRVRLGVGVARSPACIRCHARHSLSAA